MQVSIFKSLKSHTKPSQRWWIHLQFQHLGSRSRSTLSWKSIWLHRKTLAQSKANHKTKTNWFCTKIGTVVLLGYEQWTLSDFLWACVHACVYVCHLGYRQLKTQNDLVWGLWSLFQVAKSRRWEKTQWLGSFLLWTGPTYFLCLGGKAPFSSVTYKLKKLLFTLLPNISPVLLRVQKLLQNFLLFKWINSYIPYEI